ncbi:hypothetical protein ONZ45_g10711 [Pleurotus djamor]|nr:hypothetical protein ONZ45_g10711 [Pleurotus djamor]
MPSTKVIAFEVDGVLWSGVLDESAIKRHRSAALRVEDNLVQEGELIVKDRKCNPNSHVKLFVEVPSIVHDILKRGIKVAIVTKHPSAALCNRALWYFKARGADGQARPIIEMVSYNEILGPNVAKASAFRKIQAWSGAPFAEMLFFDTDSWSTEIQKELGVIVKLVDRKRGLDWSTYQEAMIGQRTTLSEPQADPYATPFYGLPPLGRLLGKGKFSKAYDSKDKPDAVIKVMEEWTAEHRWRFLEIYQIIKSGQPFKPKDDSKDEQYLLMIAFEVRNLKLTSQLIAPEPEMFTGWFMMKRAQGMALWKTPLYRQHPFSVSFQTLVKAACHLAVDEIEVMVKKYGVEHRGIAVKMKWDGRRYIRGNDVVVWGEDEAGVTYTPEEFRRYWIRWMVKTEYEANIRRGAITEQDGREFLKSMDWWYERGNIKKTPWS